MRLHPQVKRDLEGKHSHADLVEIAASFLRGKMRCKPVFAEKAAWATSERPDAFGVNAQGSVVVECKTSMDDFRADARKPFRVNPRHGMGRLRYYLTRPGMVDQVKERLPSGWGLLTIKGWYATILIESAVFNQNSNAECLLMRSAWLAGTDGIPKHEAIEAVNRFLADLTKVEKMEQEIRERYEAHLAGCPCPVCLTQP